MKHLCYYQSDHVQKALETDAFNPRHQPDALSDVITNVILCW